MMTARMECVSAVSSAPLTLRSLKLSQAQLAQQTNEKAGLIAEYESGAAHDPHGVF